MTVPAPCRWSQSRRGPFPHGILNALRKLRDKLIARGCSEEGARQLAALLFERFHQHPLPPPQFASVVTVNPVPGVEKAELQMLPRKSSSLYVPEPLLPSAPTPKLL